MRIDILEPLETTLPYTLHFVDNLLGKLTADEITKTLDALNVQYVFNDLDDQYLLKLPKQSIFNLSEPQIHKLFKQVFQLFFIDYYIDTNLSDDQLTMNVIAHRM
jgi:hypothetical protein